MLVNKEVLKKIEKEVCKDGKNFNCGFPEWCFRLVFPNLLDNEIQKILNEYAIENGPVDLYFPMF